MMLTVSQAATETVAVELLWGYLRDGQLGWRFERHRVVEGSPVDFLAPDLRLAVVLEAPCATPLARFERAAWFGALGYSLLSLSARSVRENPWRAVAQIRRKALKLGR
jgi:very-short-patch-repair endonuclease